MPRSPIISWLPAQSLRPRCRTVPCRVVGDQESHLSEAPVSLNCLAPQEPNALLEGFCPEPHPDEQIAVSSNGLMLFLRLADIAWLEGAEGSVVLHVGGHKHLRHETLETLVAKLPPGRFLRISPSTRVNVTHISELRPICHGRCAVLLRDGTRLIFVRSHLSARHGEPA